MLKDIFRINDIKAENEKLKNDLSKLEAILTPELRDFIQLKDKLDEIKFEIQQNEYILRSKINEINSLDYQIQAKKQ